MKMLFTRAWELYKEFGENFGPAIDILVSLGLLRNSQRRGKKVINEKFWPHGALDAWHVTRYSQLMGKLQGHRANILDAWAMTLAEAQQHHFKISIANMSWGETAAQETANSNVAIAFLTEMAEQPSDDARTAKADARDFIKDPAYEYPIVWLQELAGKKFTDPADLREWIGDNLEILEQAMKSSVELVKAGAEAIENTVGSPANAVTGNPASGLVNTTGNWVARAQAWRDRVN